MRWPGLLHLTATSFLRLPMGSRLRRALVERTVRAGYEAWDRDDMEAARAYADPEVEVHVAQAGDLPVGLDDVYYGPDDYCRVMEEWSGAWRSWRVEVEDVVEVAPDKVLVAGFHFGEGLKDHKGGWGFSAALVPSGLGMNRSSAPPPAWVREGVPLCLSQPARAVVMARGGLSRS